MIDLTLIFIIICFLVMIGFWLYKLFSNKKTIKNTGGWMLRIIFFLCIAVFVYFQFKIDFLSIKLWPNIIVTKIIADIVTLLGLIIMLWARKTLDKNWSANIILKENHELIMNGPYAYVRHPIYTGLILMVLGVILYINTIAFTIFFIIFCLGAYYKAKKEERLLIGHFKDGYIQYKKNVKALIPYIL